MRYQRFISYLYQYSGGEKVKNTGYVKVEQKGSMIRVSLRNKLMEQDESEYYVFLIGRGQGQEKHNHGILLDKLTPSQGMLTYQYITGQERGFGAYDSIDDFVGILIRGEKQAVYMTVWQDVEIWPDQIICVEENDREQDDIAGQSAEDGFESFEDQRFQDDSDMSDACEPNAGQQGAQASEIYDTENDVQQMHQEGGDTQDESVNTDFIEHENLFMKGGNEKVAAATGGDENRLDADYLFKNRSPLPAVEGSQLLDCIRIEPQDLGLLHMQNWKYGNNSFLNHSYYRYRYLLLGKLKFQDNSVRIILGVPSIYTGKEKYLANMFGFEQFVTARRTDRKLNQFGYWLVELTS